MRKTKCEREIEHKRIQDACHMPCGLAYSTALVVIEREREREPSPALVSMVLTGDTARTSLADDTRTHAARYNTRHSLVWRPHNSHLTTADHVSGVVSRCVCVCVCGMCLCVCKRARVRVVV